MGHYVLIIEISLALIFLILLPGLLSMFLLKKKISNLDVYEQISYGLVMGVAVWVPITWVSYRFALDSKIPIYFSMATTFFLVCLALYRGKLGANLQKIPRLGGLAFPRFSIYFFVVVIQSLLVGYTSQFQTGNSDALAHLAGLRNLAMHEVIVNYDHVLGVNTPIVNTYADNPWYLVLAMISKISGIDLVFAYTSITGIIYFFSVIAIYTLFKAMSSNISISKIGSLIFTFISLLIWIKDNGYTTFNLSSHWIIFPQAVVSFVLFPISFAAFIKYILLRDNAFLYLTILCLFVLTRFHPNWLFWAPIIISGIVVFWNLVGEKFSVKNVVSYKIILWVGLVGFFSAMGFILSKNTFTTDLNLTSPISLWRGSGGNLLYISENIYFYHPLMYFKSRGYFDIFTIAMLWYLSLKGVKNANKLILIFFSFLMTIFLIIFNPLIVVPLVKVLGSPIPLYRAFEMMWPTLSVFTIYSALVIIQLKSKKYPNLPRYTAVAVMLFGAAYLYKNALFLKGVFENHGAYYSTNSSPFEEPFATLRTLERGIISVRTPMATSIASFTDLDPITTEKWRYQTLASFEVSERENSSILAFDKPYDELVSIVNRHKIRYILIRNADLTAIDNFNKYPNLIHFKVKAGDDQIWELN